MPDAVLYARFSPRPLADECDSVEKQLERCRAYSAVARLGQSAAGPRAPNVPECPVYRYGGRLPFAAAFRLAERPGVPL